MKTLGKGRQTGQRGEACFHADASSRHVYTKRKKKSNGCNKNKEMWVIMTLPSYVDATHFHTSCRKISLSNRDFLFRIYCCFSISFQKCKRKTIVLWVSSFLKTKDNLYTDRNQQNMKEKLDELWIKIKYVAWSKDGETRKCVHGVRFPFVFFHLRNVRDKL